MKHILERHHPKYWNGTTKTTQSFLSKDMSINDINNIIFDIMQQNRDILIKKGSVGMYQIHGISNGVKYTLGIDNGRIGQLFPKKVQ